MALQHRFMAGLFGLIVISFVLAPAYGAVISADSIPHRLISASEGKAAEKPKKAKKSKGKKAGGATFHKGNGESRAERDKRLTRECKGRPNSGLCEGYARP